MSTLKVTDIQHPSASTPAIELDPVDGVVFTAASFDAAAITSGVLDAAHAPVGSIIAVKHALFTGTQTNSTAAGANFAVTDLSITHTLAAATNKLIISAYFGAAGDGSAQGRVGIAVADDGTLIGIGGADGSRTRVGAGGMVSDGAVVYAVTMPSVTFVYEPGDTASHTYTVRAINIRNTTQTLYINRALDDSDNEGFARASSGFVIQEVKV
jgi:hypothetical protein